MSVDTIRRRARIAGLWYFVASIIGVFGLVVAPGKVIVDGDPGGTATRLRNLEAIARLGMASDLASQIMFVAVVVALYRLFEHVDRRQAVWVVILGALLSVPIMMISVAAELGALFLAKGGPSLATLPPAQLEAFSYFFIRLHGTCVRLASIYWGLWLFPFGALVVKSGFIPRWLGWLLFVAGASYVADSAVWLLLPQYVDAMGKVAGVLRSGELPIIFWLLIWGARGPRANEPITRVEAVAS